MAHFTSSPAQVFHAIPLVCFAMATGISIKWHLEVFCIRSGRPGRGLRVTCDWFCGGRAPCRLHGPCEPEERRSGLQSRAPLRFQADPDPGLHCPGNLNSCSSLHWLLTENSQQRRRHDTQRNLKRKCCWIISLFILWFRYFCPVDLSAR